MGEVRSHPLNPSFAPFVILVYGDLHSYDRHATLYWEVAQALDPKRFRPARLDEAMAALRAWARQWFFWEGDWQGPPDQMETRVWSRGRTRLLFDRVAIFAVEK